MHRILLIMLTLLVAVPAPAQGQSRRRRLPAPTASLRQPAYVPALRAELERAGAERVKTEVYSHQIKSQQHRSHWAKQYRSRGHSMLGKWLGSGRYPGIWTLEGKQSWYGNHGGKPVEIKLKKNALFVDLDVPAQRRVYEKWQQKSGASATDACDMFQRIKDNQGTPLAKKVPGIKAPKHGRFLEELNIAGLVWYDTYGRRCPVLLNPNAIESVRF